MITKKINIANGVNLNYIKTDKFKTNYLSFNFITERSRRTAHLVSMIPLMLMRGSAKYPTQQSINKRLQYLYSGDVSARNTTYGEYQVFGMKANMLSDKYTPGTETTKETIDLLCELIFNPLIEKEAFNEEYTEGEKINLIDIIEAEINNKSSYANQRAVSEMCKDEVFSVRKYGKVEDVEKITPRELYSAYKAAISTYPIEIYFVGSANIEEIAKQLSARFSRIERNVISIPEAEIVTAVQGVKEIEETEKVKQGKLVLGFRTGYLPVEKRYHLLQLTNEILGASPTSKLFLNVREKLSLCYYCRSMIGHRNGAMLISSGIEVKNKEIAKNAILDQVEAIKKGDVTDKELESAKKSIKNGYMQVYDSAESMESWCLFRGLCGINTTPAKECAKIDLVELEQIMEISAGFILDTVYFLKGDEV